MPFLFRDLRKNLKTQRLFLTITQMYSEFIYALRIARAETATKVVVTSATFAELTARRSDH